MKLIYGIGAQKAGTTWLFDQLQKSPDIHGGYVKEMHYFDTLHMPSDLNHSVQRLKTLQALTKDIKDGFAPGNAKRLRQIRQVTHQLACYAAKKGDHKEYVRSLMEGHTTQNALLDVTPSYSGLSAEGFADMASVGPSKFIFILRDPVSRMWSQIRMRTKMLGTAQSDEEYQKISIDHAWHLNKIGRYPNIFRANYMRTMQSLEQSVPPEDIKYVFYEDLFRQDSMDDICAFLSVSPVPVDSDKQVNLGKSIPMDTETRVMITQQLRAQYDGVIEKFGDAVPEKWHASLAKIENSSVRSPALDAKLPKAPSTSLLQVGVRKTKSLLSRVKPIEPSNNKRPIVFLHIPKTAGQTISKQVRHAIGSRNVSPILTHSQAEIDGQFPKGYRFYGGHLDWVHMHEQLPGCFSFSVLRDPRERLASMYFFLLREAKSLSPEALDKPEHTGKRYLLSVTPDAYFFPKDGPTKAFIANAYFNKYCFYFATQKMRRGAALKNSDMAEVLKMAHENRAQVSRIYGIGQLESLQTDLSTVLGTSISFDGAQTNVGPRPDNGSRWNDLCALFENDATAAKLEPFLEWDFTFLDGLNLGENPIIGLGGDI